ncbi:MAG: phosphodiester glycosidase family protein [Ruminococcus sp.]|nr:phosphodiester glycosidase family protein [Ruminococcus sp.]
MNETPKKRRRIPWVFCYGVLLAAFTGYVMLDTFLIPRAETENAAEMNMSLFENEEPAALSSATPEDDSSQTSKRSGRKSKTSVTAENTAVTADSGSSYADDNICITLNEYRENDTDIHVAEVTLSSVQYLKTAFADDTYGRNIKAPTTEIAEDHNAIFAVNGDFYGARNKGYVIRNGIAYREVGDPSAEVLCIYADGHFEITTSGEKTVDELVDEGVWQAFSFGPALLMDGETAVTEDEEVGRAMASNPRTAVGITAEGHYIFVVSDGRTTESQGLSLSQLADFMKRLGCVTAYNLDGGGSSTMVFDGQLINNPTTSGRGTSERSVSDIVYIGY